MPFLIKYKIAGERGAQTLNVPDDVGAKLMQDRKRIDTDKPDFFEHDGKQIPFGSITYVGKTSAEKEDTRSMAAEEYRVERERVLNMNPDERARYSLSMFHCFLACISHGTDNQELNTEYLRMVAEYFKTLEGRPRMYPSLTLVKEITEKFLPPVTWKTNGVSRNVLNTIGETLTHDGQLAQDDIRSVVTPDNPIAEPEARTEEPQSMSMEDQKGLLKKI